MFVWFVCGIASFLALMAGLSLIARRYVDQRNKGGQRQGGHDRNEIQETQPAVALEKGEKSEGRAPMNDGVQPPRPRP